jgi:uncharacterized RmlC-like cupin family protein
MRAGFAQFAAFSQDVADNKVFQRTKLTMPVLAVGGEKSLGATEAVMMRNAATNVREAVVPGAGHWLMEESPAFTVALIQNFLGDRLPAAPLLDSSTGERRVTPAEFKFSEGAAGAGTSGVSGIHTSALKGDAERAGLYTIMLRIPAHTRIAAHVHQDDRVATVVSGTWYIGYGNSFDSAALKALPAGSFYTEPSGRSHFAETRDTEVVVQITGVGPSSTTYVDSASNPPRVPGKR